jgi:hypothetical protein
LLQISLFVQGRSSIWRGQSACLILSIATQVDWKLLVELFETAF